jgi:hypothetical protein
LDATQDVTIQVATQDIAQSSVKAPIKALIK